MNRFITLAVVAALSVAGITACGKDEAKKPAGDKAGGDTKTAAKTPGITVDTAWAACVACHGAEGKGDGAGAAALDPKPRDFSDAEWQAKTDDATLKKVILEGGPAVGLSATMAPNPQYKGNDEILDGLVKKIRSFKK